MNKPHGPINRKERVLKMGLHSPNRMECIPESPAALSWLLRASLSAEHWKENMMEKVRERESERQSRASNIVQPSVDFNPHGSLKHHNAA